MKNKDDQIKLLDIQMIATALIIIAFIGTMLINYNSKQTLKNNKPLFSGKTSNNLLIFDRVFILILFFVYFYVDYKSKEIALRKNHTKKQERNANLQLLASILTIIAGVIVLYVTITNKKIMQAEENPEL